MIQPTKAEIAAARFAAKREKVALRAVKTAFKRMIQQLAQYVRQLQGKPNIAQIVRQPATQRDIARYVDGITQELTLHNHNTILTFTTRSYADGFVGAMYSLNEQGIPIVLDIDKKRVLESVVGQTKLWKNGKPDPSVVEIDAMPEVGDKWGVLPNIQLSKPLYDALNADRQKIRDIIIEEMTNGLASGRQWDWIAARVARRASIPAYRARTIVRTEGHRIQQDAQNDVREQAIRRGCDIVKQWSSFLDNRTRPTHQALDGQIREQNEYFDSPSGARAKYPGFSA